VGRNKKSLLQKGTKGNGTGDKKSTEGPAKRAVKTSWELSSTKTVKLKKEGRGRRLKSGVVGGKKVAKDKNRAFMGLSQKKNTSEDGHREGGKQLEIVMREKKWCDLQLICSTRG